MNYIKKYKFTILTSIIILILLLMPSVQKPNDTISFFSSIPHFDKVVHFCLFGFIACVFVIEQELIKIKKFLLNNIIILISFAVFTEILQKLSGYRTFDVLDILADSLGIIIGTLIFYKIFKILCKKFER